MQGKIAVKQDILSDLVTGSRTSSLWKHKPCPFVYLYDKIANIDLCIDSRYWALMHVVGLGPGLGIVGQCMWL